MVEIAGALGGIGAALTIHPADRPTELVHADQGLAEIMAVLIRSGSLDWQQEHADHHIWLRGEFGRHAPHAVALPVRQVAGHSRLVITVFFATLDAERRAAADAAYLQRRPFAVGYFRLWQQERLHRRDVATLRAALDRVDIAVMLIAKSGSLAFANDAARKLLDAESGLYVRNGALRTHGGSAAVTLRVAIAHVIDANENGLSIDKAPLLKIDRAGLAPLIVAVLPAPHPVVEEGEIAALVFAVDPDVTIGEFAAPVCRVFGLTRVETELACKLASGATLQEAAASMHVQIETARTYLRAIFSKTGTNRQTDLVRLILTSLVRASDGRAFEAV